MSDTDTRWTRRTVSDMLLDPRPPFAGGDGSGDGSGEGGSGEGGKPNEPDWKAEAEKHKALSKKHEQRAKENHAEVEKLKQEMQQLKDKHDSTKSDTEKAEARIKAAEDRAKKAEDSAAEVGRKLIVAEVAADKKLTAAQAKRLSGSTREELEADADELIAAFKSDTDEKPEGGKPETRPGRPRERMRSGSSTDEEKVETDPTKLVENVPRM